MADWYFRNKQPNSLQSCPGCRNLVRVGEEFCPFCAKRLRAEGGVRGIPAVLRGFGAKIFRSPDAMTRILLGAIIVMFVVQFLVEMLIPAHFRDGGGGGLFNFPPISRITYVLLGANVQNLVSDYHQYWRLFTYCFLHIGIMHILFNSWALRDLGRLTEMLWGHRQVFVVFVLTGVAAGAVSYGWGIVLGRPRMSAGASGAICGMVGMLLGAYHKNKYHMGEQMGAQLRQWVIYILVFGLVIGADNAAHIGGLASGAALGYCLPPTRTTRTPDRDKKIWLMLTYGSAAITIICVGFVAHFAISQLFGTILSR